MSFSASKILLVTFLSPVAVARLAFCAAGGEIKFERLGVEHGLSDNGVYSIHQDIRGFMWFGTSDGLNRYDGEHFIVYRHNPLDTHSISWNNAPSIFEDRSGTLWLLGPGGREDPGKGLIRFDRLKEWFTLPLFNTAVSPPYEDAHGTLWCATSGKDSSGTICRGLFRYDQVTAAFVRCSLSNDTLTMICGNPHDDDRTLFIGTAHGIVTFNQLDGTSAHLLGGPPGAVKAIVGTRGGIIWVGTRDGLYSFSCTAKTWSHFPLRKQTIRDPRD
jgi:ligand-binding sensor domain-containing protein